MNEVALTLGLAVVSFIAGVVWGWATRPKKPQPTMPLTARIKKGKAGKWRFVIENCGGSILAVSAVTGWPTFQRTEMAVRALEDRKFVIVADPPLNTETAGEKEK